MAKVSDIVFCLRAVNVEGQGVCANTILSSISPEYIPGLFSFSVIVIVLDIEQDCEQQLKIQFVSPNGDEVLCVESLLPILVDSSNLPMEYKGVNIAMDWNNVNFKISGLYKINVLINEKLCGEKEIYVKGKNE